MVMLRSLGGAAVKFERQVMRSQWKRFALASLLMIIMAVLIGCGRSSIHASSDWLPPAKPDLPVVFSYRNAAFGQGKVAIFSNQTSNRLTITVKVEDKKRSQMKTVVIDLDPNGRAEFGWMQGWKFESGDRIEMTHQNYSPLIRTMP